MQYAYKTAIEASEAAGANVGVNRAISAVGETEMKEEQQHGISWRKMCFLSSSDYPKAHLSTYIACFRSHEEVGLFLNQCGG